MHITCTPPCKFEFCWLCLGPWTDHGERTGGFYACNRYETATYGFYLHEHEHSKRVFRVLAGEAEAGLERLHQCAENELQAYLTAEGPSKDFNEFRTELAGLTR